MVSFACRMASELSWHGVPQQHHGDFEAGRAEPVEPGRVVTRLPGAEQRLERHIVLHHRHHAAVLLGIVIDVVQRGDAARARHVAHDEDRIARLVLADEASDDARQGVVAAAGRRADHE